jgi:alpha-L-rhamnosidase
MLADLLPQALGTSAGQRPRFSRQVPDFGAGTVRRAYQLQVAATPGGFDDDRLVRDSGKRSSADSTAVPYAGPALEPRTAYRWRVSSWGETRSAWSAPILPATSVDGEWEAKPIRVPVGPVMTDGTPSVRLKITTVAAGLWFRATNTAHNYMWQLRAGSPGVLRKHVCVNGTYSVLGEVKLPFAVTAGEWADLSVTMTTPTARK